MSRSKTEYVRVDRDGKVIDTVAKPQGFVRVEKDGKASERPAGHVRVGRDGKAVVAGGEAKAVKGRRKKA